MSNTASKTADGLPLPDDRGHLRRTRRHRTGHLPAAGRAHWPARWWCWATRLLAGARRQLGLDAGKLDIRHVPLKKSPLHRGLDAANARYVLRPARRRAGRLRRRRVAAMVTAPVHKGVINDAGIAFSGHTEYLAEHTGTPRVVMMLAGAGLRVALATTHLALKDVPAAITREDLETTLRILHADMRNKFGIARPRILVAGLNPMPAKAATWAARKSR
jgi:4-hydroxythreonine-4-phosphate dehydrogenase